MAKRLFFTKKIRTIKKFHKVELDTDINLIANKIESLNITENDKRKKHIKSIKEKVNEIYDESKTVKKWVAGSLLTIVVFIFSLGSIYERFNSIKRTIDDLTIRIQHLENLHHQGGFNNANIGKN